MKKDPRAKSESGCAAMAHRFHVRVSLCSHYGSHNRWRGASLVGLPTYTVNLAITNSGAIVRISKINGRAFVRDNPFDETLRC
jgi:hypothetical protein